MGPLVWNIVSVIAGIKVIHDSKGFELVRHFDTVFKFCTAELREGKYTQRSVVCEQSRWLGREAGHAQRVSRGSGQRVETRTFQTRD